MSDKFWETVPLHEMTDAQWEALCDGCGRCCLEKLEDEDTGEIYHTNVVCRLLDQASCQCSNYRNRHRFVPTCVKVSIDNVGDLDWMPKTCAYRRLAQGLSLLDWHPLVSGDPDSVHRAGISVRGKVLSEEYVHPDEWANYIVDWWDEDADGE